METPPGSRLPGTRPATDRWLRHRSRRRGAVDIVEGGGEPTLYQLVSQVCTEAQSPAEPALSLLRCGEIGEVPRLHRKVAEYSAIFFRRWSATV